MCHKLRLQLVISHLRLSKLNASRTTTIEYKIMQKIQNTAARLILGKVPKKTPWSPQKLTLVTDTAKDRLKNTKICTLIHKCHNERTPSYLQNLIQERKTHLSLRLENKKDFLVVLHTR